MKPRTGGSLKLSKFSLNGRDVRYLSLSDNSCVCSPELFKMARMKAAPLFLATDILIGTEHDKKNFYRIHSRFAKDGLATKLIFKDAGLVGINNSSGVWFYSVQGLFQAVFEYHDRKTQQCCVVQLLDLWLARYDDARLVPAVSVEVKSTDEAVNTNIELALHSHINTPQHSPNNDTNSDQHSPGESITSDLQSVNYDSVTEASIVKFNEHSIPCTNVFPDAEHDQLPTGDSANVISVSENTSVQDILNNTFKLLKEGQDAFLHTTCIDPSQFETVCCVLQVLKDELNESLQEGFPFDLIARYQEEVNKYSPGNKNNFDISWKRDIALCVMSDWLGNKFNQLEPEIALKVEQFKTDHIESIDSLPQAEAMIDMLFPACMKCLLCSWIGVSEEKAGPRAVVDHCYGNQSKRRKQSCQTGRNLFPLIQLILEFTNNALISGVAHVVFTRLMLTT